MPRSVNPNFQKDTSVLSEDELWEHYEVCLSQHDWSYQYSDDFQVWRTGQNERDYLTRLRDKLGEDAIKMFEDRRPEGC